MKITKITLLLILSLGASFFLTTSLSAQDFWQSLNGPYGGKIIDIIAKPNGDLYALKDNNVYLSTSNGASWIAINKGFSYSNMSMAYSQSGVLYVGKSGGGIWWTANNGQSWDFNPIRVAPHSGTWISVYTVAVNNAGNIFVMGFRSLNGGLTWLDMPIANAVAQNYAFNSSQHVFAATNQGIFVSTDNGASWTSINNDLPTVNTGVIKVSSDNTLYAGTKANGVFKSANNGLNWQAVNTGISDLQITSIEASNGRIYAGTKTAGIFVSTNAGASWSSVNTGLQLSQVNSIETFSASNVYAATNDAGVFTSVNNGGGWSEANSGLFQTQFRAIAFKQPGKIFSSSAGIIHFSSNNGGSWIARKQGLPGGLIQSIAVSNTGKVFASIYQTGIYASTNDGQSWASSGTGLPSSGTYVKVMAHPDGSMFVVNPPISFVDTLKVYRSTDDGASWTNVHRETNLLNGTMDAEGNIYLWGFTAGLEGTFARSTNSGASWESQNFGPAMTPDQIAAGNNSLYMTDAHRVFRSTNKGTSWTQLNNGGWESVSNGPIIAAEGKVVVRTSLGITLTTNDGAVWTTHNTGLPEQAITCFGVDNNGFLYTATAENGLYKSTESLITNINLLGSVPSGYSLEQNYPNPFNPATKIRFSLPKESLVSLKIYDITGREINTLINSKLNAGVYETVVDGSGMASGVYFYKIITDGFTSIKKMSLIK